MELGILSHSLHMCRKDQKKKTHLLSRYNMPLTMEKNNHILYFSLTVILWSKNHYLYFIDEKIESSIC